MTAPEVAVRTNCEGAAERITTDRDTRVTADQVRAVLADTAACLRRIQDTDAWNRVARSSGDAVVFGEGFIQAVDLVEQSAYELPCCTSHTPEGCCDPEDCGPCCPACPTCPTLTGRQAVSA